MIVFLIYFSPPPPPLVRGGAVTLSAPHSSKKSMNVYNWKCYISFLIVR